MRIVDRLKALDGHSQVVVLAINRIALQRSLRECLSVAAVGGIECLALNYIECLAHLLLFQSNDGR